MLTGLKREFPHGVRSRYVLGCRCDECTRANRLYARRAAQLAAKGIGNPLVQADEVVAHVRRLSRAGVGYKQVADAAKVGNTMLQKLLNGSRTQLRKRNAERILAVTKDAASDAALVSAGRTWQRIEWLLEEGFTRRRISKELGNNGLALQIGAERVTLKTQARVEKLVRRYST